MSPKKSINNRLTIGFSLLVVFLLVFATNRIDSQHFETVQNTLTSVYKDRVVAQDYVYKMNHVIHERRIQLLDSTLVTPSEISNAAFIDLVEGFSSTKLTSKEKKVFKNLEANFEIFTDAENKINNNQGVTSKTLMAKLETVQEDLDNLAEIQVKESRSLTKLAQKSLDNNKFVSNLEIGFLILIGICIQFIIFYRVKKQGNQKQPL